jgi:hypothetical protein
VLYQLWDVIIKENDELFMHFFVVAFLQYNKDAIITTDHSQIPSVLSQLSLKTTDEVEIVAAKARELRQATPYSFRLIARNLDIFKPYSSRLKELFQLYEPENMMALPIAPSEVFHIAYNNIINCPDVMCKNFKNLYGDDENIYEGSRDEEKINECYHCLQKAANKTQASPISYILLDLRISGNSDKHYDVILPMTVILEQTELYDENVNISI